MWQLMLWRLLYAYIWSSIISHNDSWIILQYLESFYGVLRLFMRAFYQQVPLSTQSQLILALILCLLVCQHFHTLINDTNPQLQRTWRWGLHHESISKRVTSASVSFYQSLLVCSMIQGAIEIWAYSYAQSTHQILLWA